MKKICMLDEHVCLAFAGTGKRTTILPQYCSSTTGMNVNWRCCLLFGILALRSNIDNFCDRLCCDPSLFRSLCRRACVDQQSKDRMPESQTHSGGFRLNRIHYALYCRSTAGNTEVFYGLLSELIHRGLQEPGCATVLTILQLPLSSTLTEIHSEWRSSPLWNLDIDHGF